MRKMRDDIKELKNEMKIFKGTSVYENLDLNRFTKMSDKIWLHLSEIINRKGVLKDPVLKKEKPVSVMHQSPNMVDSSTDSSIWWSYINNNDVTLYRNIKHCNTTGN